MITRTLLLCLILSIRVCANEPLPRPTADQQQKWTALSDSTLNVFVDWQGRAWREVQARNLDQEEFQKQAIEAYEGKRGELSGKIILFDHQHRLWIKPAGSGDLLVLDRKHSWVKYAPKQDSDDHVFGEGGWEDHSGNTYIPDGIGLYRLGADQRWSYQPLYERNANEGRYWGVDRLIAETLHAAKPEFRAFAPLLHFVAPDGTVFVWSEWGRNGGTGTIGVLRFDGDAWTQFDKTNGFPTDEVRALLPMPDGSIAVLGRNSRRLQYWFPPGSRAVSDELRRQLERLNDADPIERDKAFDEILGFGPSIAAILDNERRSTTFPEVATRLGGILRRIRQQPDLYAGRFTCDIDAGYALQGGEVVLWASNCKDTRANKTYGQSYIVLYQDGSSKVMAAVERNPLKYYGFLEDTLGRLWVGPFRIDEKDFGLVSARRIILEERESFRPMAGPDARGRIYLMNHLRQWAILDESSDAPASDLTMKKWKADGAVVSDDGTVWGWLAEDNPKRDESRGRLYRFRSGAFGTFAEAPSGELTSMMPLKLGGVMALCQPSGEAAESGHPAVFYDGHFHGAADLRTLISENAAALKPLVDNERSAIDRFDSVRTDADGNFWVAEWDNLAVFNRATWIDLRPAITRATPDTKFAGPTSIRSLDGGKAIFLQIDSSPTSWLLKVVNNDIEAKSLDNLVAPLIFKSRSLADRDGSLWCQSANSPDAAMRLSLPSNDLRKVKGGVPIFCDREGDIWFLGVNANSLRVRRGVWTAAIQIAGINFASRMTETDDGRLFVFHTRGITELQITGDKTKRTTRQIHQWDNALPLGVECRAFFSDRANGLWILTDHDLYRVQPPAQ